MNYVVETKALSEEEAYFIGFVRSYGSVMEVYRAFTESQADQMIAGYRDTGKLTLGVRTEAPELGAMVIEPVNVIKFKGFEWIRFVELPVPDEIDISPDLLNPEVSVFSSQSTVQVSMNENPYRTTNDI
jgi:hypothetical protein